MNRFDQQVNPPELFNCAMEGRTKQFRGSSSRKAQTKGKTGHTFNEKAGKEL